jgi:double-strand break repair protein MRE11
VIWGNEHECQPQLTESLVGTYRILQPGSSIASSYASTESSLCPKHMAFFEIKDKKFRMRAIKYKQVRQFVYKDISLRDFPHLDPNHTKIEEQVRDVLVTKVNEMILEGRTGIEQESVQGDPDRSLPPVKFKLRDPQKVLVRLRVDHEGFPALNQQRFGAHFVGEVANPADVLLFAKKRKENNQRATEGKLSNRTHVGAQEDFKRIMAEGVEDEINKIKIEDLVNETLMMSNHTLSLLAETEMAQVCVLEAL